MKDIEFLSEGTFLVLPTQSRPKVYLAISNKKLAVNAFKLYNPFSAKARLLKSVTQIIAVSFNTVGKFLLPTVTSHQSNFIDFLENELKVSSITSSVYIATLKDKIVVQLQTEQHIIGYVKYPLNTVGVKNVLNEKKAIDRLFKLKLIEPYLIYNTYNNTPFLVLQAVNGIIKQDDHININVILDSFKTSKTFKLVVHPRILQLQSALRTHQLNEYLPVLERVCLASQHDYYLVYEHGDFAPWNLIHTEKSVVPFDFEYFVEEGLEFLDNLKYYFQIEHLVNGKSGIELVNTVASKFDIEEFEIILQIYLIKEIINKHEVAESYNFEHSLLNLIGREKT